MECERCGWMVQSTRLPLADRFLRNTTYVKRPLVLLSLLAVTASVNASSLAGSWAEGRGFSLELFEHGGLMCGQVTSISGQKVDASWVIGQVEGREAIVQFDSGFREGSGRGKATIRRTRGGIQWQVVENPSGESWIYGSAQTKAVRWQKHRHALVTQWCASKWDAIREGRTSDIELRP